MTLKMKFFFSFSFNNKKKISQGDTFMSKAGGQRGTRGKSEAEPWN